MIAQLRGTLEDKRPNQVLVDVGGVGYLVHVPLSTFYALGDLHSNVTLLIHTQVREDAIALYGFLSSREKHLFELLISASGVGPVLALKILSGMSVDDLVPAVRNGDLARLDAHSRRRPQDRRTHGRRAARQAGGDGNSRGCASAGCDNRHVPATLFPRCSILATSSKRPSRPSSAPGKTARRKRSRTCCAPRCSS